MTEEQQNKLFTLYAKADRLLPQSTHSKMNALIKEYPAEFEVRNRDRLPTGTTIKTLTLLAREIYRLKVGNA